MRTYGKIESGFWLNPKIRDLSDDGKMLLLYIYTCSHGNSIGCFVLPAGYIAEDLKWASERVSERVSELVSKGFIERETTVNLTRIIGWFGHNTIENVNVAKAAIKTIRSILRSEIKDNLLNDLKLHSNKFINEFWNELANEYRNPEPKPKPIPEPKPEPIIPLTPKPPEPDESPPTTKREVLPKTNGYHAVEFHPRFNEVREYITHRLPKLNRQNATEVNRWLLDGADPESDIFPCVDNCITVKGSEIGSFTYFTPSISTCISIKKERLEQDERMRKKYAKPE